MKNIDRLGYATRRINHLVHLVGNDDGSGWNSLCDSFGTRQPCIGPRQAEAPTCLACIVHTVNWSMLGQKPIAWENGDVVAWK